MNRNLTRAVALGLLAMAATSASAQDGNWSGGYLGVYAGALSDNDKSETIEFDTNLDGSYGDTVRTPGGTNIFASGFCDGEATGTTAAAGCDGNGSGSDYGFRGGFDWQSGDMVFGFVAEYGYSDTSDAVSAFATAPTLARYTMKREVDGVLALRARVGFAFGESDDNLLYATGGYAMANVNNSFHTSNQGNTYTGTGNSNANGPQLGLGYEHRFGGNFTFGVEYLATRLNDDRGEIRVQGPVPATNPFIQANAAGTDLRRSSSDIDLDALRLTMSYRF